MTEQSVPTEAAFGGDSDQYKNSIVIFMSQNQEDLGRLKYEATRTAHLEQEFNKERLRYLGILSSLADSPERNEAIGEQLQFEHTLMVTAKQVTSELGMKFAESFVSWLQATDPGIEELIIGDNQYKIVNNCLCILVKDKDGEALVYFDDYQQTNGDKRSAHSGLTKAFKEYIQLPENDRRSAVSPKIATTADWARLISDIESLLSEEQA